MKTFSLVNHNLRTILIVTAVMMLSGLFFTLVFEPFHLHTVLNGLTIGFLIGISISIAEVYFFQSIGKRFSFSILLLTRTLFYSLVIGLSIIIVIAVHESLMSSMPVQKVFELQEMKEFFSSGHFLRIFIYAFVLSLLVNFFRQINRLLGHNVLINYITGKYHKPVEEERIFMFLDLQSSTAIAEKLGNIKYHEFLNDFFFIISPAIAEHKGEIYQYVGDEVVITWRKENGLKNANCINCYFGISELIILNEEIFLERYGVVPKFKAGFHFGKVITGEIGDIKKEIVFHGDTVNTASRIRSECNRLSRNLLLSGDLINNIKLDHLKAEKMGKIKLRGKELEIELYSIYEAA